MRRFLRPWLLAGAAALVALIAIYLQQRIVPACNCYFPHYHKYGVLSSGGRCIEKTCVPPKPQSAAQ